MKHLINVGFIIVLIVVVLYVFKDDLFYSPPKIKNTEINVKLQQQESTEVSQKETTPQINMSSKQKENSRKEEDKETQVNNTVEGENSLVNIKQEQVLEDKETKPSNVKQKEKIEEVQTIEGKGTIIDVFKEENLIKGKIQINSEILEFETKYDEDIFQLLKDAKKYNLPLTFVIKKEGNKAYIEDIK